MYRPTSPSLTRAETIGNSRAPQETGELFLPEQWQFDHGVADVSDPEISHKSAHLGVIETRTLYMEDGSIYRVNESKPCPRSLKMPQTSIKTTAYLTKDDVGFNRHHQIKELEAGLSTVIVSREYAHEHPLSQARTAHNLLKIGKFIVGENDSLDPDNIQARGISRGGMLAHGATALSQNDTQYGLNVFYFSSTAPCFARPLHFDLKYLKMPAFELTSLVFHLSKLPLRALAHYPETLDLDLRFDRESALALVNGDAGRFVEYMDPDATNGYVLGYPDDIMGMGETWQEDFSKFANVAVDLDADKLSRLFNGHLRAVSHHDMSDALIRQKRLVEEYKTHSGNLKAIDYNYVSLGV